MTLPLYQKKSHAKIAVVFLEFLSVALLCFLCIVYAKEVRASLLSTLSISVRTLLPSLFPFMIISGIISHISFQGTQGAKKKRVSILSAYLVGVFCGFPIGAKLVIDLYNQNTITKSEANRLFPLVNQTGFSFCVLALGERMLENIKVGMYLYLTMLASSLFVYFLLPINDKTHEQNSRITTKTQDFSLVTLIQNSTLNIVYIIGYLLAFSIPSSLIQTLIPNKMISTVLCMPLELVSGIEAVRSSLGSGTFFLPSLAFVLSFGGICVGMQSEMVIGNQGLSMKNYYIRKGLQGVIAFMLCGFLQMLHLIV